MRPRPLAAVRREVVEGALGSAWRPALDQVWAFLRRQPGLWTGGHNVFVYHRPEASGGSMTCEFGVEVTRSFDGDGEVRPFATLSGPAAVAVHRGPYDGLAAAHRAVLDWIATSGHKPAGTWWEIYGDPLPDPADTETTVVHLLA